MEYHGWCTKPNTFKTNLVRCFACTAVALRCPQQFRGLFYRNVEKCVENT